MKVAIIGPRDYRLGPERIRTFVSTLLDSDVVVSGGAVGVDSYAEAAAREFGVPCQIFTPDYDRYPPAVAPHVRNRRIADACDVMVAYMNPLVTARHLGSWSAVRAARRLDKVVIYASGTTAIDRDFVVRMLEGCGRVSGEYVRQDSLWNGSTSGAVRIAPPYGIGCSAAAVAAWR